MKITACIFWVLIAVSGCADRKDNENFIRYSADPADDNIQFYWKNKHGEIFRSFLHLKKELDSQHRTLLFAMNGGMFKPDRSPQGLFIQEYKKLTAVDTSSGAGNFYLKPNGVFYITRDNKAHICATEKMDTANIRCATQSGPMLIIDGRVNSAFKPGSESRFTRNGAGILPDGKIIFILSKKEVNFYDFAGYFQQSGCRNALYLDGFVSRVYIAGQNPVQAGDDFGVIIGITK